MKAYKISASERLQQYRIEGLKLIRLTFGIGLKEAKDINDQVLSGVCTLIMTEEQAIELSSGGFIIEGLSAFQSSNLSRSVQIFIPDTGKKISDIKALRNATGWGLKETKYIIDAMRNPDCPVDIGVMSEYHVVKLREYGFRVTGGITEAFKDNEDLFTI